MTMPIQPDSDDELSVGAPVGTSAAMREVLASVDDVAAANTTVLLTGESGTGKEVIARYIHRMSERATGPWVAVNCAALPAELLESELFGHERGAFTGATERRIGRIEQADGGTLLLDEISELPLPLQAKLLRALQEREVDRVGGGRPIPVDVRVIATSNRDLETMVAEKSFRADLFYRLSVFPIALPPLRERRDDVAPLAEHLIGEIAQRLGRAPVKLSESALARLAAHDFPGNVRELGNLIERALVRCRVSEMTAEHLDPSLRRLDPMRVPAKAAAPTAPAPSSSLPAGMPISLAALEELAITEALRRVGGNRTHAARLLGISLRTLRNKLRLRREEGIDADISADGHLLPMGETGSASGPAWKDELARPSQEESAA
jgi:two-component system response regulator FlrC